MLLAVMVAGANATPLPDPCDKTPWWDATDVEYQFLGSHINFESFCTTDIIVSPLIITHEIDGVLYDVYFYGVGLRFVDLWPWMYDEKLLGHIGLTADGGVIEIVVTLHDDWVVQPVDNVQMNITGLECSTDVAGLYCFDIGAPGMPIPENGYHFSGDCKYNTPLGCGTYGPAEPYCSGLNAIIQWFFCQSEVNPLTGQVKRVWYIRFQTEGGRQSVIGIFAFEVDPPFTLPPPGGGLE